MLTGSEIRAGRALVRWRAADLAAKAGVNLSTIQRAEKVDGPAPLMPANEKAIRSALEAAGVVFIAENGGGAGVRRRKPTGSTEGAAPPPFAETIAAALDALPAKAAGDGGKPDGASGTTAEGQ